MSNATNKWDVFVNNPSILQERADRLISQNTDCGRQAVYLSLIPAFRKDNLLSDQVFEDLNG